MAAPASNPSHLLISRNPRTVPPAIAQTTTATSLYSPQPGPHLFSFDAAQAGAAGAAGVLSSGAGTSSSGNGNGNANGNGYPYGGPYPSSPDPAAASSYTVGGGNPSSVHVNSFANPHSHSHSHSTHSVHMHTRSHSTPAFPITPMDEDSEEDDEDDDIVVHPTFCRDAALPGRVKVIVGRYEFWCHKEVLWFASPFFNSLLQGCWAETAAAASKPSSPTDTDPSHTDRVRASEIDDEPLRDPPRSVGESSPTALRRALSSTHLELVSSPAPTPEPSANSPPSPLPPRDSPPGSRRASHPQSLNIEYDEMDQNEHKASVYLDAEEDPACAADMMRELRELPDPTGSALDLIEGREADRTPVAHSREIVPSCPPTSPPRTPPTLPLVPPERPRSAPAQNPSPPQPASPPQQSLSPPLPLRLQGMTPACPPTVTPASARRASASRDVPGAGFDPNIATWPGRTPAERGKHIDAVVELQEESPGAFQDFLFWAYPHLECKVTWTNVEGLLALSSKLIVPALQALCERFLMTHASGRPIVALALAEQHANAELYREASRFVLDQAAWDVSELACLSEQTQLKLSHRRTWFLERLLKLGSIDPKKEYTCRPDCPDPSRCQAQLDEKWRQAHQAVSRYGPPQPSVAFRCLRQLETFPTNPSLVMPHPLCQTAAKSWVMTLFDRMFQPKMAFGALSPGTEKYWLYITLT